MALALTRRHDESIDIGDDVRITVKLLDADGRTLRGQVKLVIEAPLDVPVIRSELHEVAQDGIRRRARRAGS